jgi:hypothetical protein
MKVGDRFFEGGVEYEVVEVTGHAVIATEVPKGN